MKIRILCIALAVMTVLQLAVFADAEEYVSPGSVIVPYADAGNIKIDGVLEKGEWSETNKIVFDTTNMVSWTTAKFTGPVEFFYSWCDDGLLMAAKSTDPYLRLNKAGTYTHTSQFQIALDPANIIKDDYNGLFFSFFPDDSSDNVNATKHNWKSKNDDMTYIDPTEEPLYQGKYTVVKDGDTILGWDMEVLLPWHLIATPDRKTDLDYDLDNAIPLTSFNPRDDNRKRAFITAKVCYIGHDDKGQQYGAGTFTDGVIGWETDTYDIVLLLALPGETDRSTETEYFTLGGETTEPQTETEAQTDAKTEEEQTKAPETEQANTETEAAKTTDKPKDAETKPVSNNTKSGFPWWLIVIIVAVAAVIVGIIVMIIKKKNKE